MMSPHRLRPLALTLGLVFSAGLQAQADGLKLQRSMDGPPKGRDAALPVFVSGQKIEGIGDQETRVEGDAELRKGVTSIGADRLKYSRQIDEVEAVGNVRLQREGDVMTGPSLRYRVDEGRGVFDKPDYSLAPRKRPNRVPMSAHGSATRLEIEGEDRYRMTGGTFTTCQPGNEDWYVRAGELDLDYGRSLGVARSAQLVFMGTPIIAAPWLEFSLNNERKSGFLPPTIGTSGKSGGEFAMPYYWNIAPNRDATLTPRVLAKRGLQLGTEFRYLEKTYVGEARYEVLPEDKAKNRSRFALTAMHTFNSPTGFSGGWNINKVSDDDYFRDLSSKINITSQTNLVREAYANYGGRWWGDGSWGVTGRVQRYQTLQDLTNPIDVPYGRVPQLSLSASKQVVGGADLDIAGEYVDFSHPTKVIGKRSSAYPSLSLPIVTPGAFLTPKIGYNWAHYELERNGVTGPGSVNRSMPIYSIDSGLTFERAARFGGQDIVQTLEPRLFYLNVPFRDQSAIPLFDTAVADFNYAQIFSENVFSGKDRIADANQLTAALTSRTLLPNGQELMRATIGQRYYFKNQQVLLNPTDAPRTYTSSDWLASFSGRVAPSWTADTAIQYNSRLDRTERFSASARYQPEVQKVMNLGYRFNRDTLHQIDASAQWPLVGRLYGVGRYNFSMKDGKLVEGLAGLEYDGGCWIVRVVMQRFATAAGTTNNSLFVQLELNGFSRIGSNPMEALKRNISGYTRLNQPADPNQPFNYHD